ncbi:hypothetical protein MYX65_04660 [Acidobacteria bacterium AH-259-L09]|nr:hypothetical protein [Acidobacteria bacterium AH-259-L09]
MLQPSKVLSVKGYQVFQVDTHAEIDRHRNGAGLNHIDHTKALKATSASLVPWLKAGGFGGRVEASDFSRAWQYHHVLLWSLKTG